MKKKEKSKMRKVVKHKVDIIEPLYNLQGCSKKTFIKIRKIIGQDILRSDNAGEMLWKLKAYVIAMIIEEQSIAEAIVENNLRLQVIKK